MVTETKFIMKMRYFEANHGQISQICHENPEQDTKKQNEVKQTRFIMKIKTIH